MKSKIEREKERPDHAKTGTPVDNSAVVVVNAPAMTCTDTSRPPSLAVLEPRKADIQRADLYPRLTIYSGLRHTAFS